MKIQLSNNIEEITIDTTILWYLNENKSFDQLLTEILLNMKKQGFHVITDIRNFEGWEYISANLEKGELILA
jgi:hypothetical protein